MGTICVSSGPVTIGCSLTSAMCTCGLLIVPPVRVKNKDHHIAVACHETLGFHINHSDIFLQTHTNIDFDNDVAAGTGHNLDDRALGQYLYNTGTIAGLTLPI